MADLPYQDYQLGFCVYMCVGTSRGVGDFAYNFYSMFLCVGEINQKTSQYNRCERCQSTYPEKCWFSLALRCTQLILPESIKEERI